MKKDFRNIDKVLKPYDLKTSITKKDGVKIVGDEAKIRYCISEYIFNSKGYFGIEENQFYQSIFKEQEIEKLKECLKTKESICTSIQKSVVHDSAY